MLSSSLLSWVLTIVFVLTGAYALGRWALLASGATRDGDRLAELTHLLMSVAMVAMVWGLSGGPESASGLLQIVVFTVLGVGFGVSTLRPATGHARISCGYHLSAAAAMVWMVVAMPVLMGVSAGSSAASGGGHAGHAGHGGSDPGAVTVPGAGGVDAAPPTWALVVNAAVVVVLVLASVWWARQLVRSRAFRPAPAVARVLEPAASVVAPGSATPSALPSAPPEAARACSSDGPRSAVACHVLMSLGMAAMLLAMA